MAGRLVSWARKQGRQRLGRTRASDIAVVPARPWALGLMIVASAGALLATSAPHYAVYRFEASSDGPRATLTASKARASYLVRVRVTALGPEGVDTRESALATVHGTITSSGNPSGDPSGNPSGNGGSNVGTSPFVQVRFHTPGQASDGIAVLTSFQLPQSLFFSGDCAKPGEGTPCEAEVQLDFDLKQPSALAADGSLSIDWSVDFESRAFRSNDAKDDETLAAPWSLEIVEIVEP